MSALQVDKARKNELQDGRVLSSSNLSTEWQAFESTFEEDYYAPNNCTAAVGDVSHLLELNDDDLDPTFLSFFEDNDGEIFNSPKKPEVTDGSPCNEISIKEFISNNSTESENVNGCSKSQLSEGGISTVPSFDVADSEVKTDLQNLNTEKSSSRRLSSSGESKPKTGKSFSGKSKKSDAITRTVTTETIFNGSIADIVKTRKRRAQCLSKNGDSVASDYAVSQEINVEFSNTEFTSSQMPVETTDAHVTSLPAAERSPEIVANPSIKIKISLPKNADLPECQNNSSASKKIHRKKKKRKRVSNSGETCPELKPENVNILNVKPEVVEEEKCIEELSLQQEDQKNIVKNSLALHTPQVDVEHSGTNGYCSVNDKKSGSGELSSFISNTYASKNSSVSEHVSRSEVKLSDSKKECMEQPVNAPSTKKKLRGIEEYKAHKAKCKQQDTLPGCVLSPSPPYVPPVSPSNSSNQNTVANYLANFGSKLQNAGIEIPLLKSDSLKSSLASTCNLPNLYPSDMKHTVWGNSDKDEFQVKKSPPSEHFPLANVAGGSYNSVSSKVPASSATTTAKSEIIENSAISLLKSSAPCLQIQTHLPKDQCAFMKKSSQISADLEVTKTSHDIPASIDSRCQGAQLLVTTEHVNSTVPPCDKTGSKTKHNSRSPIPLCTVHSTQPKHNASVIGKELSSPGTSAKKYSDDMQACKELSRSRSVSSSSSSSSSQSSDRYYKHQKRNHSSSPASDTLSVSSYKRQGSYNSKSATYKKHSLGHSLKSCRLPSKPKKFVKDSRYRSHSRSSSSSSSSVRYRRRKRRKTRSRSQSYSRSPSTSDDDFTYDTYKMNGNVHRSSLSPVSRRERRSKHHSRFQNYSSTKQRSPSRSSHHYANSKYLKYTALPSHRKERRRHRQYSTSSYSTDSYSRHHESSSRSRSRSRSYDRSYYKQYQPYRRQQQLSWEEQQKQIDERRVVYVGLIPDGYTRVELRERFQSFGEILSVRIHKRVTRRNDNFGFVTFKEKLDAYKAVEYGNAHPLEPKFDISFGGRKGFCKQEYSDLDKENEMKESCHIPPMYQDDISFDKLLKAELQRVKIQSKKC